MRQLTLLIWLLLGGGVVQGQSLDSLSFQQDDAGVPTLEQQVTNAKKRSQSPGGREYASEKIEVRKFDDQKWRKIVGSDSYTDTRTRKSPEDQGAERGGSGRRTRGSDDNDRGRYEYDDEDSGINVAWLGPLGTIIFYMAIAAIIVVILMQIVRNTSFKSNLKRPTATGNSAEEIHDISELDTEDLIRKAHHAGDYKLAVRLYFLDLLKKLNENGVIVWTKDKTNRDYLSELFSKQFHFEEIRRLTLAYERVWYGEHIPTEKSYHQLRNDFQQTNQKFKAL